MVPTQPYSTAKSRIPFISNSLTYDGHIANAARYDAHPVSINSQAENDYVVQLCQDNGMIDRFNGGAIWLGLTGHDTAHSGGNSTIRWLDGTSYDIYKNWGHPGYEDDQQIKKYISKKT